MNVSNPVLRAVAICLAALLLLDLMGLIIRHLAGATGAIALLAAPTAWAGGDCGFGHSRTTAQTARADATLPQSAPAAAVEQAAATVPDTDESAETTVAAAVPETQKQ